MFVKRLGRKGWNVNILFSPVNIGSMRLANRIVVPPMCQYSADREGCATDWHLLHYGSLALSGAGLLIVEATAVEPEGRISGNDLGLWSDASEAALKNMLSRIRAYSDTPIAVQLAHAGRKGSRVAFSEETLLPDAGGWQVVAPSALAYGEDYPTPLALDAAGIGRVVERFADAAARADRAGFDCIEVHAAHGYLLHEFLSPIANRRTDAYGGELENRMRLVLEVFSVVRDVLPSEKPVGIRISGSDWVEGGWDIGESAVLAAALEKRGCSYIHVSGGGLSLDQKLRVGPGYQIGMAAKVKRATSMPVIGVGLIIDPEQAETILEAGNADLVAVGRGMLYDPRWPWHAAERLGASLKAPQQYLRARPHGRPDLFVR